MLQAKALPIDARARAVLGVVHPGDDEATIAQRGNCRVFLTVPSRSVDQEFGTYGGTAGVVTLPIDAPTRPVLAAVHPGNDKTAIAQCGDGGVVLVIGSGSADMEFSPSGGTAGVVTLPIDAPTRPVLAAVHPGNDKTAIAQCGDGGVVLVIGSGSADMEFSPSGGTAGVVALPIDAPTRTVLSAVHPRNDKPAIAECGDGRGILVVRGSRINLEFATSGGPAGSVALPKNTPARSILCAIHPGNDKATINERGDSR